MYAYVFTFCLHSRSVAGSNPQKDTYVPMNIPVYDPYIHKAVLHTYVGKYIHNTFQSLHQNYRASMFTNFLLPLTPSDGPPRGLGDSRLLIGQIRFTL
jgi:hypothetical protein